MRLSPLAPIHAFVLAASAIPVAAQAQEAPTPPPVVPRPAKSVAPRTAPVPAGQPFARLKIAPDDSAFRAHERDVERAEREVERAARRVADLHARGYVSRAQATPTPDREALEREVKEREEQLRAAQKALNEARSRLVQERAKSATRSAQLNVPTFFFQTQTAPLSPEMARKTASLMALRSIVQLGLTKAEIEVALPVLRQLQESAKALEAESSKALEEEQAALLAAKPGEVPSSTTSARLRDASNRHRQEQQKAWDALAKAVGSPKASGLRRLLGEAGAARIWDIRTGSEYGATSRPRGADEVLSLSEPNLLAPAISVLGPGPSIAMFRGGTISLSELIDLLSQRTAALKE